MRWRNRKVSNESNCFEEHTQKDKGGDIVVAKEDFLAKNTKMRLVCGKGQHEKIRIKT